MDWRAEENNSNCLPVQQVYYAAINHEYQHTQPNNSTHIVHTLKCINRHLKL